LVLKPKTGFWF